MKHKLLTVLFIGILLLMQTSGESKPPAVSSYGLYEIECAGAGSQGTQLVRVWASSKVRGVNIDMLKRFAVHGVIFKGYAGGNGCTSQKPMATSPSLEQQRANFFDPFFNTDKAYNKYASQMGKGIERVKVGRETRVGAVISVSKDMLRRDLEAAGVLRGLTDGF